MKPLIEQHRKVISTIAIINAIGRLGDHVIDALLELGLEASDNLALGRARDRLGVPVGRGLRTATDDLTDKAATTTTLSGVDKLLLISVGATGEALAPRTRFARRSMRRIDMAARSPRSTLDRWVALHYFVEELSKLWRPRYLCLQPPTWSPEFQWNHSEDRRRP